MTWTIRIFVILLFLTKAEFSLSQTGRDKVEALRVEFISKSLELTNSEYEKFWPVYNEYNDKIRAIRKNLRHGYRNKTDDLSEKEAEQLYYLFVQSKQAEADVHKQYNEKIKSIIGAKKTVKLHVAEEEFRMKVMKSIKGDSD
ncbi:hypothetical protein [Aurantibacillus circumpalustris]|uniref:hypothetical protein n=1 Tax=Aurantibacillus circumpalustris TaxID=3036359 RepID=UPI00295C0F3F|nr:hypothetical protein [Aurantibacillus circumpalustris]